jgi:hypothetical protein
MVLALAERNETQTAETLEALKRHLGAQSTAVHAMQFLSGKTAFAAIVLATLRVGIVRRVVGPDKHVRRQLLVDHVTRGVNATVSSRTLTSL